MVNGGRVNYKNYIYNSGESQYLNFKILKIICVIWVRVDYPSVAPSGSPKKMNFFGKSKFKIN